METLIKILAQHSVNYKMENGRLLADEMIVGQVTYIDVTEYSIELS